MARYVGRLGVFGRELGRRGDERPLVCARPAEPALNSIGLGGETCASIADSQGHASLVRASSGAASRAVCAAFFAETWPRDLSDLLVGSVIAMGPVSYPGLFPQAPGVWYRGPGV